MCKGHRSMVGVVLGLGFGEGCTCVDAPASLVAHQLCCCHAMASSSRQVVCLVAQVCWLLCLLQHLQASWIALHGHAIHQAFGRACFCTIRILLCCIPPIA